MTDATPSDSLVNIAVAERETGLGKDTLRVWERRYGFPCPVRDENGDRVYPREQIARLRLMKRLMDQGHRPGKVVSATDEVLRSLDLHPLSISRDKGVHRNHAGRPSQQIASDFCENLLTALYSHDSGLLRTQLAMQLARDGLEEFVVSTLPRYNTLVGEAWARGELQVFEEHLYSEQVQALLRQAIAGLPIGTGRARVLLTTVPGERHALGLLMVEAYLSLRGLTTVALGPQTPLLDIAAAAAAHQADSVALSFSTAFPARQLAPLIQELRALLPTNVSLWVGGQGLSRLSRLPENVVGIARLTDLDPLCESKLER